MYTFWIKYLGLVLCVDSYPLILGQPLPILFSTTHCNLGHYWFTVED